MSSLRSLFLLFLCYSTLAQMTSSQSSLSSEAQRHIDVRNMPWGDPMTATKPEGCLRLFLQNPNGISAAHNFTDFEFFCQSMKAREVDIFGLSETAVDWKKFHSNTTCRQIISKFWDHSRFRGSTSAIAAPKMYKPGGTCMAVTGKWTGRIDKFQSDDVLGRWTSARLTGKHGRKVIIMTIYQVCKNSIQRAGPKQAFTQQWALLRSQDNENPDPRLQFAIDLDSFLEPYAAAGDEILIMGDFNEWLGSSDDTALKDLIQKYGLHDVLGHYHDTDTEVATYKRGSKRIDYFLATGPLTEAVIRSGMLPFDELYSSDHRGMFLDIDVDAFLGGDPPSLMSRALRGVNSQSPKQSRTYVATLHEQLSQHNLFDRVKKLSTATNEHGLTDQLKVKWETVDRDLTDACRYAEKKSGNSDRPPWSPKLHNAHLEVLYWKTTLSGLRTERDVTPVTQQLLQRLCWPSHPDETTDIALTKTKHFEKDPSRSPRSPRVVSPSESRNRSKSWQH